MEAMVGVSSSCLYMYLGGNLKNLFGRFDIIGLNGHCMALPKTASSSFCTNKTWPEAALVFSLYYNENTSKQILV